MTSTPAAPVSQKGFVPPRWLLCVGLAVSGIIIGLLPQFFLLIIDLHDLVQKIDICEFEQSMRAQGNTRVADNYIIPCLQYRVVTNPVLGNPLALILILGLCVLAIILLRNAWMYYHVDITSGTVVGREFSSLGGSEDYALLVSGITRGGNRLMVTHEVEMMDYLKYADGDPIVLA